MTELPVFCAIDAPIVGVLMVFCPPADGSQAGGVGGQGIRMFAALIVWPLFIELFKNRFSVPTESFK
jgi:hypothetical protein